jgi:hypothetical protein
MECFGRETRESTGGAGGGRTNMRILASKGRLDFTNLREKKKYFPRFPIHTWYYETRIHFCKIKRRHILETAKFEVFLTAFKSLKWSSPVCSNTWVHINQDRQCGTYKRNLEARSRNHCRRGEAAVIIVYIPSVYCSRNYPACKARAPYYVVNCVLSVSTIFFHIIS